MFENRVLRRISGPKSSEVTGSGENYIMRSLMYSVLLTQYCSGDKIEKNEMGWACSAYGGEEKPMQGFGGKSEGKRPLGRPRRRWEVTIKMDFQEVGRGGMDWIELSQDRDRWRHL